MSDEIHAAGGVVVRDGRIAVVHRPRYDDWSLPKGKLDAGESWEEAALREVEEETGLRCRLATSSTPVHYAPKGRPQGGALVARWSRVDDRGTSPTTRSTSFAGWRSRRRCAC